MHYKSFSQVAREKASVSIPGLSGSNVVSKSNGDPPPFDNTKKHPVIAHSTTVYQFVIGILFTMVY